MNNSILIFAFSAIFIIVFIFLVVVVLRKNKTKIMEDDFMGLSGSSTTQGSTTQGDHKFSFKGDFFYIHNHLNKKISIKSSNFGDEPVLEILPKSKEGINKSVAYHMFLNRENSKRSGVRVYTLDHGITPLHPDVEHFFGEFQFKTPENTIIKELHIGMVTSKSIGSHIAEDVTPGANAVQGRSRIYIHNLSPKYLRLNYNILIPPNDTLIYYGFDYFGVRLGTVFKDQDGIFDDFIYTIPATDIIYGVTSDFDNPKFGGFALDEKGLTDIPHEPQFLLEEGWMGGPAFSKVDPTFLPYDGVTILPIDRWGRFIKNKEKIKEWEHGDDRKPFKIQGNLHIT